MTGRVHSRAPWFNGVGRKNTIKGRGVDKPRLKSLGFDDD
jgi:hypothetical protein